MQKLFNKDIFKGYQYSNILNGDPALHAGV